MLHLHKQHGRGSYLTLALAGVLAVGFGTVQPVHGAEAAKLEGSVNFVPSDAAFYSVMLHNREQIEIIAHSKAWAKLKSLPAAKLLWHKFQQELKKPNGQLAPLVQFYQQPENRQLVALLGDMTSEEIFIYGDADWVEFLDLSMKLVNAVRFGPLMGQLSALQGGGPREADQLAILRQLVKALQANQKEIRVPGLIIGFRLSKNEPAEAQLKRLETFLKGRLAKKPQLKGRLQRTKVAGHDYLTFTVDGSMVPWDQVPFDKVTDNPDQAKKVVAKLKQVKLTFSLGIRDNYLLFALGESTAVLKKLGQGQALIDLPELKPVAKLADQRLTSVEYASKALNAKVQTSGSDIDNLVALAERYVKKLKLPADKQAQIAKDLKSLGTDVKKYLPIPGAQMAVTFLTDRGQESYTYDYGKYPSLTATKPLTILNHVGGSPILAAAGRAGDRLAQYKTLVKWLKKANGYFEELVVANWEADQKEQYEQVTKVVYPLLERLDSVTAKMLLPALADGQYAFVLDAKIKSKQWLALIPETEKELPMLEPALVFGVSDAALLRRAFREYRDILNDTIAKVRELSGGRTPEIEIPPPETKEVKSGVLYYYPLPETLGLDPQILPNAGLSKKVAVLTISSKQSERLLTSTPLTAKAGPLADLKRPLASAVSFRWAALVEAATPWIELGVQRGAPKMLEDAPPDAKEALTGGKGVEGLLSQVRTILDVLKVLRSYTSATYLEDGVLVTHGETVFRDQ